MKISTGIPSTSFEDRRYRVAFSWLLFFLLLFILPVNDLWALEPGTPVYVRVGKNGGDWTPAEYVGARSDCLLLERLRPYPSKAPFLKVPAQIKEEGSEVGQEVIEELSSKPLPNSKMPPIVDRVLAVRQDCHEVKNAGGPFRFYVLSGNVLTTAQFDALRGSAKQFSVGDKVYAKEYRLTPERWSLRKVVAQRDDCFETDSEKVLCGHYREDKYLAESGGHLFAIPPTISKIFKKGDLLDGFSMKVEQSAEGAAYTTLEGVVKSKSNDTLIIESSNDDCSYDPVSVANIRQAPSPLSVKDFAALKPGDIVLERIDPACCCCNPYYAAHKIVSHKRSCYLLQKEIEGSETEAHIPSQLIPVEAFGK